ncbi:hypothetical protein HS088_TW06G00564 [Tripterygium wilfordii]|uniref:WW domain-containing protein n=1 Tax=Tripterygium wilfordii TaxID=458696 RepID=A0A7J7DJA5_TRIWF|nr:uncharacterized protein LOC120001097 [Tripterygium wilfordii]KAF5746393.1 hypothetical protein HS088_TW06G00564 [Tripterygium wilfordii]
MTAPNMAAITESLERSLQNCSLNNTHQNGVVISRESRRSSPSSSTSSSSPSAAPENHHSQSSSETTLELNSHLSLPYHWEQCLDLKTGEVYYVNWRNGMKAKEDPRTNNIMTEYNSNRDLYSEYEEENTYDTEESSSESGSPPSPSPSRSIEQYGGDHVLVVAGCKSCLMYFMVPKQLEDCPKCNGQLLHFDRSEAGSP